MFWSEMIEDFRYLDFRMRASGGKHGGCHNNLCGSLSDEVFHGVFQGWSTKLVIGKSEQGAIELRL